MTTSSVSPADPALFSFNVAHVATIQTSLLELASRLNFSVGQEVDDLEEYDVAYLQLRDGFHFYLCKYKSRPPSETEVFFASQLIDWEARLREICSALGIDSSALLWKNTAYMKTA
ncbi:hypothetical protein QFZ42_000171 [Variovorax paradoxus]|uniref:hypothetical protein n=1 Tax=Variovorax paradoxus TaxID=34073 RepID=UPI00278DC5D7|nr:hypothetical protein [Variovorax paradoxus]MDQ0568337.1 hypothetical protein [Variovorax paradoxus]